MFISGPIQFNEVDINPYDKPKKKLTKGKW